MEKYALPQRAAIIAFAAWLTRSVLLHTGPGPECRAAAYIRTSEREQTILIGGPFEIGSRQHDNGAPLCDTYGVSRRL